jgi:hypothetical protein
VLVLHAERKRAKKQAEEARRAILVFFWRFFIVCLYYRTMRGCFFRGCVHNFASQNAPGRQRSFVGQLFWKLSLMAVYCKGIMVNWEKFLWWFVVGDIKTGLSRIGFNFGELAGKLAYRNIKLGFLWVFFSSFLQFFTIL